MSNNESITFAERGKEHAPTRGDTGAPKPGPRPVPRPSAEARRWGEAWIETIGQPRAFRDTNQQAMYLMAAVDAVLEAGAGCVSIEEQIARVLSDPAQARQVIGGAAADRETTCVEDHLMEHFSPRGRRSQSRWWSG